MLVSDILSLARLFAQDTDAAATHQPIGNTRYLLMFNSVARTFKANLDLRPRWLSATDSGLTIPQGSAYKKTTVTNIREITEVRLISSAGQSAPETSDGVARFIPWFEMTRRLTGFPDDGPYYSFTRLGTATGADQGKILFAYTPVPTDIAGTPLGLLATVFHSDLAIGDPFDASPEECSNVAILVGVWASALLDRDAAFVENLWRMLSPEWQAVFQSQMQAAKAPLTNVGPR